MFPSLQPTRSRLPTGVLAVGTLATLFSIALAEPAASQRRGSGEKSGGGYFQAGYMGLDLDPLNTALTGAGYPSLDGTFLTLGGGGYGTRGDFLFGGEGHGLLGSDETTADGAYRLSAGGGYGLFRVGYLAFSESGLDVFPLVGIGGGGMSVQIAERSAPVFGDILDDPQRSSTVTTGMFLLDASVAAHYRIAVEEDDDEGIGGVLLGLQAGYTFAPGDTSWRLDGINTVAGGPQFQIEGLYLRASVGGWGEREEDD